MKRKMIDRKLFTQPVMPPENRFTAMSVTVYRWINQYRTVPAEMIPTQKALGALRRKAERAEQICQILKLVDCTTSAPRQVKLYELEKLVGQFPIRVLCDALDVDRGTFYNHIKRNKKENSV